MSLLFAGFPVATFDEMGTAAKVLATIRAECDRQGRCFEDQRDLAEKASLPLSTFNYHVGRFKRRGVIAMVYRRKRQSAVIVILPEHRWVTPEKPASTAKVCPTQLDTKNKATLEKETSPDRPPLRGGDAPDSQHPKLDSEIEVSPESQSPKLGREIEVSAEPPRRTFGPCLKCGAERDHPPPTPCARCGSTRRTPYGQPRAPRRPRPSRQRQRKQSLYDAFMEAAARHREQTTTAGPARPALPPPPDIIPPGHDLVAGEVIPMPRGPLQRPRGFSPATDILEAFQYAAAKSAARDRTERRDPARPLLGTG